MINLSYEEQLRIRKQFDKFCKIVLRNEMIDYERHRNYVHSHEIYFSDMTETELSKLSVKDEYSVETDTFYVLGYEVNVHDMLISEALRCLPQKKRDVILLSFFLEMTDTEIAECMHLVRSTIHHHRTSSLQILKRILEGLNYE